MSFKLVILPGDGIGSEVCREAVKVLKEVTKIAGISIEIEEMLIGGASLDTYGVPVTEEVLASCEAAGAVFLGAIGGPEWDNNAPELRPEKGLLALRKRLGTYTNFRPVKVIDSLIGSAPLKAELVKNVDMLIVRELTGGLYFGQPKHIRENSGISEAVDTMAYNSIEIERITHAAFGAARMRKNKVTSVDKANILATSQLWRKTVDTVAREYPEVKYEHMLVDNCAMQLIRCPEQFDVILTENTFGDILSDEASVLCGSLGMLPSASLGGSGGLYEPVHGSAPDIAGKNMANPIAAINSMAMMLRYTFQQPEAAELIENAVIDVLSQGYRTRDIHTPGLKLTATDEMGSLIADSVNISKNVKNVKTAEIPVSVTE